MKQLVPVLLLLLLLTAQEGAAQTGPWAKFDNRMKGNALVRDAGGGDLAEVKSIIAGGGDVNWQLDGGLTPLIAAASAGHTYIVRYLLQQGADPGLKDGNGKTARDRAWQDGASDIVRLLDYYTKHQQLPADTRKADPTGPWAKFNPRMKGQALLRDASGGYLDEVKSIVAGGGDVNWQSIPEGQTPLMAAAWQGRTEVVRYLLEQGANPTLKDEAGKTALDYARQGGANDIVRLLAPYGQKAPAAKTAAAPQKKPAAAPAKTNPANAPARQAAAKPQPAAGNRTTWPPLGTYQPGDTVQFFAGKWKRGVIKEVGKSYNPAAKNADAFELKYLVAPDAYANWPDWMHWSQVVQPRREPFWTSWFLDDWKLGEVMAVTTEREGSYERNAYSYHSATDVLRINANGTYKWKPMGDKEISGRWTPAPDGPGIVLLKGYRGHNWTIRNDCTATEMHIRKIENARLFPSSATEMSMAAKRPLK